MKRLMKLEVIIEMILFRLLGNILGSLKKRDFWLLEIIVILCYVEIFVLLIGWEMVWMCVSFIYILGACRNEGGRVFFFRKRKRKRKE